MKRNWCLSAALLAAVCCLPAVSMARYPVPSQPFVADDNTVSLYSFDEGTLDTSGSVPVLDDISYYQNGTGWNLSAYGPEGYTEPFLDDDAVHGKAIRFMGPGGGFLGPYGQGIHPGTSSWQVEAFVKPDFDNMGPYAAVFGMGGSSGDGYFRLQIYKNHGLMKLYMSPPGENGITVKCTHVNQGGAAVAYDTILNDGSYHHVATVLDRETESAHIYLDGMECFDNTTVPPTFGQSTAGLPALGDVGSTYRVTLGNFNSWGCFQENNMEFVGLIDEFRISNKVRLPQPSQPSESKTPLFAMSFDDVTLQDSVRDITLIGHDGNLGPLKFENNGAWGRGVYLPGNDDGGIDGWHSAALTDLGDSSLMLEAYIRPNMDDMPANAMIYSLGGTLGGRAAWLRLASKNNLYAYFGNEAGDTVNTICKFIEEGGVETSVESIIGDGEWHYVQVFFDRVGQRLRVSLDGRSCYYRKDINDIDGDGDFDEPIYSSSPSNPFSLLTDFGPMTGTYNLFVGNFAPWYASEGSLSGTFAYAGGLDELRISKVVPEPIDMALRIDPSFGTLDLSQYRHQVELEGVELVPTEFGVAYAFDGSSRIISFGAVQRN